MANLHITEFTALAQDGAAFPAVMQLPPMPPVAEQTVAIGGSSAASSAFNVATRFVRLIADADCHVAVGADPTATTSNMKLISGQAEYFGVTPGHKIAAVTA